MPQANSLGGFIADTLVNYGEVTAPGGSTLISDLTIGPAGTYLVFIDIHLGGAAPAAGDRSNMSINLPGTPKLNFPAVANVPFTIGPFRITVAANGHVTIASVGAATAGVVYAATVRATQLG